MALTRLRLRVRDDDSQSLHAESEAGQPLDELRREQPDRLSLVGASCRGGVFLVPLVELGADLPDTGVLSKYLRLVECMCAQP